jgi:hypothetical protein
MVMFLRFGISLPEAGLLNPETVDRAIGFISIRRSLPAALHNQTICFSNDLYVMIVFYFWVRLGHNNTSRSCQPSAVSHQLSEQRELHPRLAES